MSRLVLGFLASFALALAPALAAPLVVFGDSTVDAGSAQLGAVSVGAPNPTPAELGYFRGRFSNGPNAADYVDLALNGELTTSYLLGGANFSFGAAAIVTDINQGGPGLPTAIPDLTDQVNTYLALGEVDPGAAFYVSAGGNDFLAAARGVSTPEAIAAAALDGLVTQLRRLAEAGASTVAVSNVNAAGFALGGDVALAQAVEGYNAALADALVALTLETGTRFALVDRDGVFDRIIADPLRFGFDPALLGRDCIADGAQPDCAGYVLFDPIHVTTRTQEVIADAVLDALREGEVVPLPGALALFGTGLVAFAGARRRAGA